ncbi:MAG: mono/diheme cytochrome c family protein [Cellvibrionaceae bacterium]|jgi:mono/diheme cytochrome c family protein
MFIIITISLLTACNSDEHARHVKTSQSDTIDTLVKHADTKRWFNDEQRQLGKQVFITNCAVCHGKETEGTTQWKTPNSNGQYPPPPLNGSAHAWHHPFSSLLAVVREGGSAYGGMMPAWKNTLNDNEMIAAIAFFQSYWPDEVYERWIEIENISRER